MGFSGPQDLRTTRCGTQVHPVATSSHISATNGAAACVRVQRPFGELLLCLQADARFVEPSPTRHVRTASVLQRYGTDGPKLSVTWLCYDRRPLNGPPFMDAPHETATA